MAMTATKFQTKAYPKSGKRKNERGISESQKCKKNT